MRIVIVTHHAAVDYSLAIVQDGVGAGRDVALQVPADFKTSAHTSHCTYDYNNAGALCTRVMAARNRV
jgi:hypothetical protein